MYKVRNFLSSSIIWATLITSPQVVNAQDHTNNVVTNTINGVSQNNFHMEHQLILKHKFRQENARGWILNQNSTYQRLRNHSASRYQTLTWWMHNTPESRTVRECDEWVSPINSNLYSERRAALQPYIDCLYENEIKKWRTPEDILSNSYELQRMQPMASENIMRDLVNKSTSEIHRDLLIRKWALLNPNSKAYRWLAGE